MYECTICQAVNHNSRHHCQVCGTIPKQYSILGVPEKLFTDVCGYMKFIEVVAAFGSAPPHKNQRLNLRTQELDYYADSE